MGPEPTCASPALLRSQCARMHCSPSAALALDNGRGSMQMRTPAMVQFERHKLYPEKFQQVLGRPVAQLSGLNCVDDDLWCQQQNTAGHTQASIPRNNAARKQLHLARRLLLLHPRLYSKERCRTKQLSLARKLLLPGPPQGARNACCRQGSGCTGSHEFAKATATCSRQWSWPPAFRG